LPPLDADAIGYRPPEGSAAQNPRTEDAPAQPTSSEPQEEYSPAKPPKLHVPLDVRVKERRNPAYAAAALMSAAIVLALLVSQTWQNQGAAPTTTLAPQAVSTTSAPPKRPPVPAAEAKLPCGDNRTWLEFTKSLRSALAANDTGFCFGAKASEQASSPGCDRNTVLDYCWWESYIRVRNASLCINIADQTLRNRCEARGKVPQQPQASTPLNLTESLCSDAGVMRNVTAIIMRGVLANRTDVCGSGALMDLASSPTCNRAGVTDYCLWRIFLRTRDGSICGNITGEPYKSLCLTRELQNNRTRGTA
jgi:hypothetical protein